MTVKWTNEQQKVIENKGSNLLVSAAAGSGKTAVLIERIIRLILDEKNPVDIDRLLVVTFTKAAASQMREKVGKAIEKKLIEFPNNEHLQKQLLLLNSADITTIDSFCKSILTSYSHLVGYDSNVKVIEPSENEILEKEILEEYFEELYTNESEEFLKLLQWYANKNTDEGLSNLLLNINNFVNSNPFPEKWLDEKAEFFNTEDKTFDFYYENYIYDLVLEKKINFEFYFSNLEKFYIDISNYEELETFGETIREFLDTYEEVYENIKLFLKQVNDESYKDLLDSVNRVKGIKLKSFRISKKVDSLSREYYDSIKDTIKALKDNISKESLELNLNISDIKMENELIYPYIRAISNLVIGFRERLLKRKQKINSVNFSDIEHFALNILLDEKDGEYIPSKVAMDYMKKYEEVFIDEYQDSNLVQEIILSAVSRKENPNRFMVGDVKQSIYRFRQADPSIFMKKYFEYDHAENTESKNRKIMLYSNFRSREEILEGTNLIFSQIMRKDTGELDYTIEEKLNPMAKFEENNTPLKVGGAIEVHILNKTLEENEEFDIDPEIKEQLEDIKAFRMEGYKIANIIHKMVREDKNFGVYDEQLGTYRNVTYKDIVILMRSPSSNLSVLEEIFEEYKIPLYSESRGGYFESVEIRTLINLLRVIDNPMQDIPLLSVMKSPIYDFNTKDLSKIRLYNRDLDFYTLLVEISKEEDFDKEIKEKIIRLLNDLELFREQSTLLNTAQLIWFVLRYTGYYDYISLLENGIQMQSNLNLLYEKATLFEKNSYKGLFNFINYIEKLKLKDTANAKLISEDANVVRVMTIHKSKGLEFPVVILANTDKKFRFKNNESKIELHQELGYGATVYDFENKISFSSYMKKRIEKTQKKEQLAEEMRLLYVALTRAKEKLIITSKPIDYNKMVEKLQNAVTDLQNNLSSFEIINSTNYLTWIMLSINNIKKNNLNISSWCKNKLEDIFEIKISETVDEIQQTNEIINFVENTDINTQKVLEREDYFNISEFLEDRFSKSYKYNTILHKPSSISVSEIKKMIEADENIHEEYYGYGNKEIAQKTPEFIHKGENNKKYSSSEKGTIIHLVMQLLDFSKIEKNNSTEEIKYQIENLISKNIITKEEADTVNTFWINNFVNSQIFEEIKKAQEKSKLYKEKAINYNLYLKDLYKGENISNEEKVMVVGIIDLFFENENGEIVLIDYKTDYVTEENIEEIKERYKIQLELYKDSIERNSGKKVAKKGLYLFGINRFVEL